jgi:hypothetical protein
MVVFQLVVLPPHEPSTLLVSLMRFPPLDEPVRETLDLQGRECVVQIACRKVVTPLSSSNEHLQLEGA